MRIAYVANSQLYGPVLLDELAYTDQIPPGSPQAVPGASSANPGVTVNYNEGDQIANVGLVPTGYANKEYSLVELDLSAAGSQEVDYRGTILFAVWGDGGGDYPANPTPDNAAVAFVQINRNTAGKIPIVAGFQLSGIPFNKLFFSWPAQADKKLVILLSSDAPLDRLDTAN